MPLKIKTNLKVMKNFTQDVKKRFAEEVSAGDVGYELIRTLQDIIRKGISPVDGEGRFEKYSEGYKEAIKKNHGGQFTGKRVSPVSMYLTGEMLGSLETKIVNGVAVIEFSDEKAGYHHHGTGNLPKRKLLPTNSKQKFNKRITQLIVKALKKALKK